jgi:leucine dehydrogenase
VFSSVATGGHEEVVYGHDAGSGLKTIIAIHSTALGPALGGTRFFPYGNEEDALRDVLRLSRGMTYKAAAAGLDLGGGKAVIIGDPRKDKSERMLRAYGRIVDSLHGRYITAEDVGTTAADIEIIRRETPWALGMTVVDGGSGDPSPVTARGLFAALRGVAKFLWDDPDVAGRRIAVQGVGKVGMAFVQLLVEARAEVVVTDSHEPHLTRAVEDLGVKAVAPDDVYVVDCDVFSPCALGATLNKETIPRLSCVAVVGSANNQLAEPSDAELLAQRGILYAPDFVVNAGGLINVYEELRGYSAARALHRVEGIYHATINVLESARREGIDPNRAAERLAEERIEQISDLRRFGQDGRTGL